eukprot:12326087-Alexandrium_andersonii.AAC.1
MTVPCVPRGAPEHHRSRQLQLRIEYAQTISRDEAASPNDPQGESALSKTRAQQKTRMSFV